MEIGSFGPDGRRAEKVTAKPYVVVESSWGSLLARGVPTRSLVWPHSRWWYQAAARSLRGGPLYMLKKATHFISVRCPGVPTREASSVISLVLAAGWGGTGGSGKAPHLQGTFSQTSFSTPSFVFDKKKTRRGATTVIG